MRLFNKTIDRQLFKQYALGSDLAKQEVVVKIFNPQGAGYWFILNSDPQDPDYLWAIVDLGYGAEVGSVSRTDLETYRGRFGLGFERDLSFDPVNALELYNGLRNGEYYAKGGGVDDYSDLYGQEVMALKNAKTQAKKTKYDYVVYQNEEGEISFARKNDFDTFFDKDKLDILYSVNSDGLAKNITAKTNPNGNSFDNVFLNYGFTKKRGAYGIRPYENKKFGTYAQIDDKTRSIEIETPDDQYKGGYSLTGVVNFLKSKGFEENGFYADGGEIEVVYERRADFKKKPIKLLLLNKGREQKGYTFSGKDQVAVLDNYNRNKQEDLEKLWNLKGYETKYADGGNISDFTDNQQMIMNQNVELEHHHEELEDILKDEMPVPAWVVAKMATATQSISDVTHYLDGEKELMEEEMEDENEEEDEDQDEIENKIVVEPIDVSAGTKTDLTKNFTDEAMGNLRGFLKGMEGVDLRDDYTFDYKDEQYEVEPIINSDENGVSNAVFSIFDGDGEEVGDVTYSREGGKQKFTANSEFFSWNNAKFEDGGFMNNVYADGGGVKDDYKELSDSIRSTGKQLTWEEFNPLKRAFIERSLEQKFENKPFKDYYLYSILDKSFYERFKDARKELTRLKRLIFNPKLIKKVMRDNNIKASVQEANRIRGASTASKGYNLTENLENGTINTYRIDEVDFNKIVVDLKKAGFVIERTKEPKRDTMMGGMGNGMIDLKPYYTVKQVMEFYDNYDFEDGGYFDGTIPKTSSYMSNFANGGGIEWDKDSDSIRAEMGEFKIMITPQTQRGYYDVNVKANNKTIGNEYDVYGIDNAKNKAYEIISESNKFAKGGGVDDYISMKRLLSEFKNEKEIFDGQIVNRGTNDFKIENDNFYIKRPNENWKIFRKIKYADGGETEEGVDLFEDYDNIPPKLQAVLDKYEYAFQDGDYRDLEKALKAVNAIGYTFEYYLDGQAYDLRKIGQKGKSEVEEYAKGGGLGKKYYVIDAKDAKILSKGFDTEEEAKVEKFKIFKKTNNFFLTQKGVEDVRMKYAKKDIATLIKDGNMSMYDTKYGIIHLNYNNGEITIKNNKYDFQKEDYQTIFKGGKDAGLFFIAESYIVEEMANGGGIDYHKFYEVSASTKNGYDLYKINGIEDQDVFIGNYKSIKEANQAGEKLGLEKRPMWLRYGKGGAMSNFDKLSAKVAKNYEGKPVKKEFQKEYGKVYSKKEAQEVGDKVAGKVKSMQTVKKEMGGETKKRSGSETLKQANILAKKIRKDGESWNDAKKRAFAQLKK